MRTRRFIAIIAATTVVGVLGFNGIAAAGDEDFRATMTGANEFPGPGDPDGSAKGKVEIDLATNEVCFKFSWENIATPTLGHIHVGDATEAGPVVVDLLGSISPDTLESDDDVKACVIHDDPALLQDIVANPDQYYLNLHNPRFMAGAVRGQLEPR